MTEPYYPGYIDIYEKWLASSPYVREVTTRLTDLLAGKQSMLDIGAGTGVFSLAAEKDIAVTAVEESAVMRALLSKRAAEQGRTVPIIPYKWEQAIVTEDAYDVVLCANAIYTMEPLTNSLAKMISTARSSVLIVMNGRKGLGVFGKMRSEFRDLSYDSTPLPRHTLDDVRRALDRLGASYETELVKWKEETIFRDYDAAMCYVGTKLGTTIWGDTMTGIVSNYLEDRGDCVVLADDVTMAFITIRV